MEEGILVDMDTESVTEKLGLGRCNRVTINQFAVLTSSNILRHGYMRQDVGTSYYAIKACYESTELSSLAFVAFPFVF